MENLKKKTTATKSISKTKICFFNALFNYLQSVGRRIPPQSLTKTSCLGLQRIRKKLWNKSTCTVFYTVTWHWILFCNQFNLQIHSYLLLLIHLVSVNNKINTDFVIVLCLLVILFP